MLARPFDFGRAAPSARPWLLGSGRAGEVVVNVLLPFLHASEAGPTIERLPAGLWPCTGVTRRLPGTASPVRWRAGLEERTEPRHPEPRAASKASSISTDTGVIRETAPLARPEGRGRTCKVKGRINAMARTPVACSAVASLID